MLFVLFQKFNLTYFLLLLYIILQLQNFNKINKYWNFIIKKLKRGKYFNQLRFSNLIKFIRKNKVY